jgi:hypothetical protein
MVAETMIVAPRAGVKRFRGGRGRFGKQNARRWKDGQVWMKHFKQTDGMGY